MNLVSESAVQILKEAGFEDSDIINFVSDYYKTQIASKDKKLLDLFGDLEEKLAEAKNVTYNISRYTLGE